MGAPSFHVASGHSRLDRDNRRKLIDEFSRKGDIVTDDGGRIVEVLNYCIERRIAFELSWCGKLTSVVRK